MTGRLYIDIIILKNARNIIMHLFNNLQLKYFFKALSFQKLQKIYAISICYTVSVPIGDPFYVDLYILES